jgi:hypothetical protein
LAPIDTHRAKRVDVDRIFWAGSMVGLGGNLGPECPGRTKVLSFSLFSDIRMNG